jgi:hypothetical protein
MTAAYIINRKKQIAEQQAAIRAVLDWSELEYGTFQYECGLAYLRHYITHDKWGQDMLQRSQMFWNWWKNQWATRDQAFIAEHGEGLKKERTETAQTFYRYLHDPATLASEIYPGRLVMDESYSSMIGSMIKKEVYGKAY